MASAAVVRRSSTLPTIVAITITSVVVRARAVVVSRTVMMAVSVSVSFSVAVTVIVSTCFGRILVSDGANYCWRRSGIVMIVNGREFRLVLFRAFVVVVMTVQVC
jgi:hypothetical protein